MGSGQHDLLLPLLFVAQGYAERAAEVTKDAGRRRTQRKSRAISAERHPGWEGREKEKGFAQSVGESKLEFVVT